MFLFKQLWLFSAGLFLWPRFLLRLFEVQRVAALRDALFDLKSLLAEDEGLKPWERIKLMAGDE